ncbi:TetR family transcriptional regulator [Nocardioides sp. CER19]|uniref:TetR family transcriptional regulator n=1 Tax=Nocardioides sp. CER19 TaxID=3038538 RepID=UPI00244C2598|nr:TetR family transcriptional regulator [Nocardioides sp. CER19]MDH2416498.1 TetR family transcriptional regulator [Nocardioides sp. CER19]
MCLAPGRARVTATAGGGHVAIGSATSKQERSSGSPAQRERRTRMLDATIGLASEGGFDAVQMREVAERADVALGTLYRYFPSKIHLLVAALYRELETTEARTATRATPGDTPHERVMFMLSRMTRGLQKQPQLTEALVRAFMFADATVSDEIHSVGMRLTTMISRAIAGDPEHDEATDEEAAIIRIIADVWLAALVSWVTGRTSAAEVERSVDVAVGLLLP